jgi:hypothetical protein
MTTSTKLMMTLVLGLFALSMAQFTPSPFICAPKQFFNIDSAICVSCSTATDTVCGAPDNTCQAFWFDSEAQACNDCTSILNTDSSKVSAAATECACKDQYYWDPTSKSCLGCDGSSNEASCNSCNNIFNADTCKPCSAFENSNGQYDPVNKGCFCKPGFVWDSASFSCV